MTSENSPFFGVPLPVAELASNLVDFVERSLGIRPDFSPDTLSIVDHYAVQARDEVRSRPEISDLTAQALGAYFGEVLRRSEGGFYLVPSPNFHDWSLCGENAFVSLNPIGVGYDALMGSQDHSGPSSQLKLAAEDRESVASRLAALPEVGEGEYYSLCTRLEVMQIVMAHVRSAAESRGYADMLYTAEDYGADLRPLSAF